LQSGSFVLVTEETRSSYSRGERSMNFHVDEEIRGEPLPCPKTGEAVLGTGKAKTHLTGRETGIIHSCAKKKGWSWRVNVGQVLGG